jgi:hypothetical protein
VSKESQRSRGDQSVRGRTVCDLIAETVEDSQRTDNLVHLIHATTDSLIRLVYATALPVGLISLVLVLASNGRPQLFGLIGLASAGVASIAATARIVRKRLNMSPPGKPPELSDAGHR